MDCQIFQECSPTMLVVLITPPPVDENGRMAYARYNILIFYIAMHVMPFLSTIYPLT